MNLNGQVTNDDRREVCSSLAARLDIFKQWMTAAHVEQDRMGSWQLCSRNHEVDIAHWPECNIAVDRLSQKGALQHNHGDAGVAQASKYRPELSIEEHVFDGAGNVGPSHPLPYIGRDASPRAALLEALEEQGCEAMVGCRSGDLVPVRRRLTAGGQATEQEFLGTGPVRMACSRREDIAFVPARSDPGLEHERLRLGHPDPLAVDLVHLRPSAVSIFRLTVNDSTGTRATRQE
jgi:hypothetical protein